jgi:hypothetical protein
MEEETFGGGEGETEGETEDETMSRKNEKYLQALASASLAVVKEEVSRFSY